MRKAIPILLFTGLAMAIAQTNAPTPAASPKEFAANGARDVRIVSGIKVDLGPVHDFEKSPSGERPLKHWKKISFLSVGPAIAGQATCSIKIKDGGESTVVMKNVPPAITQAYANVQRLTDEHQKLVNQLTRDTKAAAQSIQNTQADADTGVIDPNRIRQATATSTSLQNAAAEITRLEQSIKQATTHFNSVASEYAMFTGQKAGAVEIWDCGLKVK